MNKPELRVCGHSYRTMIELVEAVMDRVNSGNFRSTEATIDDIADILYVCDYARLCISLHPEIQGPQWIDDDGELSKFALNYFRKREKANKKKGIQT